MYVRKDRIKKWVEEAYQDVSRAGNLFISEMISGDDIGNDELTKIINGFNNLTVALEDVLFKLDNPVELKEEDAPQEKKYKLIRNRLRCKKCGDIIESKYVHDFNWCSCESVFIDGGLDYARCGGDLENIEDMTEWEEVKE